MSVKISSFEFENVKRIKAVSLEPNANGLTIIGGRNGQGKTSVLDAICWTIGGEKFRPTNAARDGSYTEPLLRVTLSNGLVAERRGKNSALKVIDPNGNRSGQQLLSSFITQLALDLPRFMNSSDKEKAETLLNILGIGDKLAELEHEETQLYNRRTAIGQIADQKKKYAEELKRWENVPDIPISASELIAQQQEILAHNAENRRKRMQKEKYEAEYERARQELDEAKRRFAQAQADFLTASNEVDKLIADASTEELEKQLEEVETINAKVRDNMNKAHAEEEAAELRRQYEQLTEEIKAIRDERRGLLDKADLPLPELSVEDGKLLYRGKAWDCMSGAEQLRVSTAIVRRLSPECGFVLLDKLEQMDTDTLREFGEWLEAEGLQAIATRVSTGDECAIIIEDGCEAPPKEATEKSDSGNWDALNW